MTPTATPGPWKIGRQNRHDAWIHNDAGKTVAYIHNATGYRPDCSDDPNSQLIAAAPDLLAALVELELRTRQFIAGDLVSFPAALLPQVRAVIAQATGTH